MKPVVRPANQDRNPSRARPLLHAHPGHASGTLIALAALCGLGACKPTMVVGEYACPVDDTDGGSPPSTTDPIVAPWGTGFENGPCDYTKVAGICYRFPPAAFRVVDHPVHSGQYAAEITVATGTDGGSEPQGRCFRLGVLPVEAYYGAWFFIPNALTNSGLWNLIHFRGDSSPPGLWDVNLTNRTSADGGTTGELALELYSRFLSSDARFSRAVPIGRWFHVVLYLKRAKDKTGAVALYLGDDRAGDQKVTEFTNLVTDDSNLGQWYVGNLASDTNPPECTVYLDDVSIRSSL